VANAIFTTQAAPAYDDIPEVKYHFPKRYLGRVEQTVGDWIIYYEPRRADGMESNRDGRQVYYAMARVLRIEQDATRGDHYYAYVADYVEFPEPVSFRLDGRLLESSVRNADGSVNPGSFINAIRLLQRQEFEMIRRLGMLPTLEDSSATGMPPMTDLAVAETQTDYAGPRDDMLVSRPVRDAAFSRVVRRAYDRTCAMTGLKLINGGGRCEIEAAHIKPVEDDGPDSPRNGIALSRTVHWLFDRGFLSIADDGAILLARSGVPDPVQRLLNPDRRILLPANSILAPHRVFLRYHRERKFKG
jgi:putative restriction endonuclease